MAKGLGVCLRIRGWGDCPGLSSGTLCYHKDPYKSEGGGLESESDVVMDAVVQVMQGHEPRNAGNF